MKKISKKSMCLVICSGIIILLLILFFLAPAPLIFIKNAFNSTVVYGLKVLIRQPCGKFDYETRHECPSYCYVRPYCGFVTPTTCLDKPPDPCPPISDGWVP